MVISIEERREISRKNGARSRGPKTHETKLICSRNSLKHGYYAVVHNLPDEDPFEILELRARYFADLAPKTVAEEFLTQQCFQAHLQANRVERARRAKLAKQMEAATASWHDQRDAAVGKLWSQLTDSVDARDILTELRTTTLGLRALAAEWTRHKEALESRGYLLPGELSSMVLLSGCQSYPRMLFEDEDAYRLYLWNFQCEPELEHDMIKRMLVPANRPPALRDADRDELLPSTAECLARLKQWVDDVLVELHEESERVWTEVEAPALARRTDPQTLIINDTDEGRIHRASNDYRATFYKAHNALEASRKRAAAEAKEARRNADRGDSRGFEEREVSAGRAGPNTASATTPVASTESPAVASESRAVASDSVVEVRAEVAPPEVKSRSRNEPSFGTEIIEEMGVVAGPIDRVAGPTGGVLIAAPPVTGELGAGRPEGGGAVALTRPSATLSRGERGAFPSGDDWRRPPSSAPPAGVCETTVSIATSSG
jgi:hypothetical protein